jgi:heat shock protein HtpX
MIIKGVELMNETQWLRHKLWIEFQTFLLVAAMSALLGALGWVIAGEVMAIFVLILMIGSYYILPRISPHLLLRMNRCRELKPYEAPKIHGLVHALARRGEFKNLPTLYYLPSDQLNAFAAGSVENGAIALSDGLLRRLNLDEVAGVLAHEMSHLKHDDLKILAFADLSSRVTGILSVIGQVFLLINLPLVLFMNYQINWWVILLLIFAPNIGDFLFLTLSRTREYDADLGAVELTGDPESLALALSKIHNHQNSILKRLLFRGYKITEPILMRTHPPTQERIRRLIQVGENKREIYRLPTRASRVGSGANRISF